MSNFSLDPELSKKIVESMAVNPLQPRISHVIERRNQEMLEEVSLFAEEREARENAKLKALQETAEETKSIRVRQDKIIDNQQRLIEIQDSAMEVLSQELQVLKNIFASGEDGVAVQKEIMDKLIELEQNKHPIREFIADKGGDIGVEVLKVAVPLMLAEVKGWLATKGILIP